jgi:hypothetical protein
VDPFTLLAIAKGAVSAIKQGCELYNEFKGHLVEAKDAVDEVRGIVTEVTGFWGNFKKWWSGEPEPAPDQPKPKAKPSKKLQEFDEIEVRRDIADNLVKFFKALESLKNHIAEEEEKSRNVYDPDQNLMEAALHRVLALDEMEKLQYEIRQVMVYETPGMGDLYTRVIKMVGVISEEQEVARIQKVRADRDARWRRRQAQEKAVDVLLAAVGIVLLALYLGGAWWILVKDRMDRWGF